MNNPNNEEKNVKELSVIELKAICFDLQEKIKYLSNQYNQVFDILTKKIQEEK